jgi:hypothetical protein
MIEDDQFNVIVLDDYKLCYRLNQVHVLIFR